MVVFSPPSKLPSLAWLPTVVRVPYSAPKALLWHVAPQTRYAFVQHCIELRSQPNVDTKTPFSATRTHMPWHAANQSTGHDRRHCISRHSTVQNKRVSLGVNG